jgi:hypothetical protein
MEMFIDDNYAMEYIIWEDAILKQNNNKDDSTDITDIDFDIVS